MDLSTPLNFALAIFGISMLVVVHEAGHYLAARAFGMRVLRFSIGLGSPIWKYQPKGSPTTFQICALPLLAYVQIDGMNPSDDIDPNDPTLYPNKGVFARIVTIVGGPVANYLAASLLIFGMSLVGGLPDVEPAGSNEVGRVYPGTPAALAGLQVGDRIVEANGKAVTHVKHLLAANARRGGQMTTYVVEREGERINYEFMPEVGDGGRVVVGVMMHYRQIYRTFPLEEAAENALVLPWRATLANLAGIARLVRNRSTQGITSVVGMTEQMAQSVEMGAQEYIWRLMLISVALGLFNLLPFPGLDGGRLVFLGYELITRRRPNERVEATIQMAGLLFLLGVLVLVMVRDVVNLT